MNREWAATLAYHFFFRLFVVHEKSLRFKAMNPAKRKRQPSRHGEVATFEDLQTALLAGLQSGPATPMTQKDWRKLHDEVNKSARNECPRTGSA